MMWISIRERLPNRGDGDSDGKVLVWHDIQGAMLAQWDSVDKNRFHTHWMNIEVFAQEGWICADVRKPTKADADVFQCVLVVDRHKGHHITGWHQVRDGSTITQWQRLPEKPRA